MRRFIGSGLLLTALAVSCVKHDNPEELLATSRQDLSISELTRIFSFEGNIGSSGDWVPASGSVVSSTDQKSDGSRSMAISGSSSVTVTSTALSAVGTVAGGLGLDVWLPASLVGVSYKGYVQAFFNSPTLQLYSYSTANVPLGTLTPGQFSPVTIPLDPNLTQKLSQSGYSDLKITLVFGLANTTSKTYIDHLTIGSPPPGGSGGTSSGGSGSGGVVSGGAIATGGNGTGGVTTGGVSGSSVGGSPTSGGSLTGGSSTGGVALGGAIGTSMAGSGGTGNNVALGKPATASSELLPSNPASYGNDSASDTEWCASATTLPATWRVDLGGTYDITGTSITWPAAAAGYGYVIQASPDNVAFSNVVDKQSNQSSAQIQSDSFAFRGQYVGIQITQLPTSGSRACLRDFQVMGTPVPGQVGAGGTSNIGAGGATTTGTSSSSGGNASGSATSTTGGISTGGTSAGGMSGGGGASGGGSAPPTIPITFSFQLPKGVDRSRIAVSATSGELWVNDRAKIETLAGNGHYSSIAAVAGGRVTRLGTFVQVQNLWSEGNVTMANSAVVHGDLSTRGSIDGQDGYLIQGKTIYDAPINPTEIVSWTVAFPEMTAEATILDPTSGTTSPSPGAYSGFVVNRDAHLKLVAGTYFFNKLTVESQGYLDIDNSAGAVIVYVRNDLTLRGNHTRVIDRGGFMVAYAGLNEVHLESPYRGILVAPNARITLATTQDPYAGAFYAKALTIHQTNFVTHEPWMHDTLCASEDACSPICPCSASDQAVCEANVDCQAGLSCTSGGRCGCVPQCAGKQCGDDLADGCGGTCTMVCQDGEIGCVPGRGDCAEGSLCFAGRGNLKGFPAATDVCLPAICQEVDASQGNCGSVDAPCGICSACTPNCGGRNCGPDGCGGSCGSPSADQICLGGVLVNAYDPASDHSTGFPAAIATNFATINGEAGAIPGSFGVTDRGMASYKIPIQLPPGRHGLLPNLSLNYESTRSTGMVGLGWAIGGFSKIERCNRTVAVHGSADPISLTAADAFCLDGVVLVDTIAEGGVGLKPAHTHDTELDRFQVIRAIGDEYRDDYYVGPASFRVWTKDGYILTYGAVEEYNLLALGSSSTREDALVDTYGVHRVWHLSQIEDHAGNFASFIYQRTTEINYPHAGERTPETTTEILPMRVLYGQKQDPSSPGSNPYFGPTAAVEFTFIENPKPTHHYVAGYLTYQTKILSRIDTYTQSLAGYSANPVMTYKLDYTAPDELAPRLQSVTQCSRGPTASGANSERCLPPTKFDYTRFEGYQKLDFGSDRLQLDGCTPSDFDGDGQQEAHCVDWIVKYDNASKQVHLTKPGALRFNHYIGELVMDVNRDGNDDTVSYCSKSIYFTERGASGDYFSREADLFLPSDPFASYEGCFYDWARIGDVDGDGLDDLILEHGDGVAWKRQENSGFGPERRLIQRSGSGLHFHWEYVLTFDRDGDGDLDIFYLDRTSREFHDVTESNEIPIGGITVARLDVNGDGLLDILEYRQPVDVTSELPWPNDYPQGSSFVLWVNTGTSFIAKPVVAPWLCNFPEQRALVIDIDHDGRDDVFFPGIEQSTCASGVLRATRGGTLKWDTNVDPDLLSDNDSNRRKALDLNGDGVMDIISPNYAWVSKSTGPGLLLQVTNGLGERISVEYKATVDWPANDGTGAVTTLPSYSPDIPPLPLDTARDLRRVTPLVSGYRVDQTVYSTGEPVVAGESHRFHYKNGRMGTNGRGWFGFREKWEALLEPNGNLVSDTRTTFHNDQYWRAGLVAEIRTTSGMLPNGYRREVTTTNEWQNLLSPASNHVYPWLRHQVTIESEFNELRRIEREWIPDSFGNAASSSTKVFVFDEERATTIVDTAYHIDSAKWLVSQPELVTTADVHGNDTEFRQIRYGYTDDGLLASVIREPNRPEMQVTATYERSPLSRNVERVTISGPDGDSRASRTVFDQRDLFPIAVENANGEVTEVQYDGRNGALLTSKDPNGVVTQWGYDPFGRVELVKTPTQQLERSYRHAEDQLYSPVGGNLWIAETQYERVSPNGRITIRNLDGRGRVVRTITSGLGAKNVYQESRLDWAGRILRQTLPHEESSTSQGAYQYPRDVLGRVTASIAPDGRATQYEYYNLANAMATGLFWDDSVYATMRLDPNGLATYEYADERNQLVKVLQYDPSSGASPATAVTAGFASVSQYEMGAFGLPRSVTDPDGEVTTLQIDPWGRRLQIDSDSTGQTTNSYNAFDEVIDETDANGDKLCFSYDELGRPTATRRSEAGGACTSTGELVSSWQYGVNIGEIGRLVSSYRQAQAGSSIGTIDSYRYEMELPGVPYSARLKSVERLVPGLSESLTTSYDYDGPYLATVHYPSAAGTPFAVQYERDDVGNIIRVSDASGAGQPATEYWRLLDDDEGQRIASESMANGVTVTNYGYQNLSAGCGGSAACMPGALRMIRTAPAANMSNSLQHLEYRYDAGGYLNHIEYLTASHSVGTDDFTNDVFGRLKAHEDRQGGNWYSTTYDYSPGGDLQSVTRGTVGGNAVVDDYNYEPSRPRLVESFRTTNYGYDLKGRRISRSSSVPSGVSQAIAYNDLDLPEAMTVGGSDVHRFEYDGAGARSVTRAPDITTIYAGEHYRCTGATQSGSRNVECDEHHYGVFAGDRLIAEITKDSFGNTSKQRYIHGDHLGSASVITDDAGALIERRKFEPFGAPRSDFTDSDLHAGFTGHEHDSALGLIYMRGRMYDPALKRFITPDPFVTQPWNPQGLNRFSYVQNSPLNFWDPSGFQQEPPDQSAAGAPDRSGGAHQSGYESYANGGTGNWFTDGGGLGGAGNQGAGAAQPGGVAGYPDPSGGDQCRAGGTVREANGAAGSPQGPDPGSMAPVAQGGGTPQNGGATQPASGPASDAGGHAERSGDGSGQGGAGNRPAQKQGWNGANGNNKDITYLREMPREDVQLLVDILLLGAGAMEGLAARGAGCPGCLCFVPGTQVLMADGTTKAIEDVVPGDEVVAVDPGNDDTAAAHKVVAVRQNWTESVIRVEFGDDLPSSYVEATGEHPFWTQNAGWIAASELKAGDRLLDANGQVVPVINVTKELRSASTYNLSVEGVHTFFVVGGRHSVLVHNEQPRIHSLDPDWAQKGAHVTANGIEVKITGGGTPGSIRVSPVFSRDIKNPNLAAAIRSVEQALQNSKWRSKLLSQTRSATKMLGQGLTALERSASGATRALEVTLERMGCP